MPPPRPAHNDNVRGLKALDDALIGDGRPRARGMNLAPMDVEHAHGEAATREDTRAANVGRSPTLTHVQRAAEDRNLRKRPHVDWRRA
jgi:hypothetical protein